MSEATSLALRAPSGLTLARVEAPVLQALRALCRDSQGETASNEEIAVFAQYCAKKGLDPFSRQVYWTRNKGRVNFLTSIDGFRGRSEASGKYKGRVGPYWMGPDHEWRDYWVESQPPLAAKVGILRSDFEEPIWGFARYKSFVGPSGSAWDKCPEIMLAKCAESQAHRAAFPERCGGMYLPEEMGTDQADDLVVEGVIVDEPERPAPATDAPKKSRYKQIDIGAGRPVDQAPSEAPKKDPPVEKSSTDPEPAPVSSGPSALEEMKSNFWEGCRSIWPGETTTKVKQFFGNISIKNATPAELNEWWEKIGPLVAEVRAAEQAAEL